jgi:hypothetical protein
MISSRFRAITKKYRGLRIAVVGDFCLDRYLEIDPARQERSIETGLPVHNSRTCGRSGAAQPARGLRDAGRAWHRRSFAFGRGCPCAGAAAARPDRYCWGRGFGYGQSHGRGGGRRNLARSVGDRQCRRIGRHPSTRHHGNGLGSSDRSTHRRRSLAARRDSRT